MDGDQKRINGYEPRQAECLLSFTSTWLAFFCGNITSNQAEYGFFWFNCHRDHVLGAGVPKEARNVVSGGDLLFPCEIVNGKIAESRLPEDVVDKWREFVDMISVADEEGRVSWKDARGLPNAPRLKPTKDSWAEFMDHRDLEAPLLRAGLQPTPPRNMHPAVLAAYLTVVIPKSELEDGATYKGICRNASEAVWSADKEEFTYDRTKWGHSFKETIKHLEDDDGYDVFLPIRKKE